MLPRARDASARCAACRRGSPWMGISGGGGGLTLCAERPSSPVILPAGQLARKGTRGAEAQSVANEVDADYNEYLQACVPLRGACVRARTRVRSPWPRRALPQSLAPDGVVGREVLKRLGGWPAAARRAVRGVGGHRSGCARAASRFADQAKVPPKRGGR